MKKDNKIKTAFLILFIGIVISIFLCGIFVLNVKRKTTIDLNNYEIEEINDNYLFDINAIKEDGKYCVEGYMCKKNINIETSSIYVVAKETNGKCYKMPTYVKYIEELNGKTNEIELGWSGFKSIIDNEDCELYILLNINDEEKIIDLNIKLEDIIRYE